MNFILLLVADKSYAFINNYSILVKRIFLQTCFLFLIVAVLHGQNYRAVPLIHPDGQFVATGLNDLGQVSGYVRINFVNHPLILEPSGQFTELMKLGGTFHETAGINELGQVLGITSDEDRVKYVVIWEQNNFRVLAMPLEARDVLPEDINNIGEAVGFFFDSSFVTHAVFWDTEGNVHNLPEPENKTTAFGINDLGEIVGDATDSMGKNRPILWRPKEDTLGKFEIIELVPQGKTGTALKINNHSEVVGFSSSNAFFWKNDQFKELTSLGGSFSVAYCINDSSNIVGTSQVQAFSENTNKNISLKMRLIEKSHRNYSKSNFISELKGTVRSRKQEEDRATGWTDPEDPFDYNNLIIDSIPPILSEAQEINNTGMVLAFSFFNNTFYCLSPMLLIDSDMDGLSDIVETNTGIFVDSSNTGTDPLIADTDEDGLLDGEEVNTFGTDPNVADTDGDGLNDGEEISLGQNPLMRDVVDLEIVKTALEYVRAGFPLTYEITVRNKGDTEQNSTDVPNLVISESLPDGVTFVSVTEGVQCESDPITGQLVCEIGELKSGESKTISLTVLVQADIGEQLSNTANVLAPGFYDPHLLSNSDIAITRVVKGIADLSIVKRIPGNISERPAGQNLVYQFSVTNRGDAVNGISAIDILPEWISFVEGEGCSVNEDTVTCQFDLAANGFHIFNFRVNIDSSAPVGSTISNTAFVKLPEQVIDPNSSNNVSAQVNFTVLPAETIVKITDPNTRFHRLFIQGYYRWWSPWEGPGFIDDMAEMEDHLLVSENQADGSSYTRLIEPTSTQFKSAIDSLKSRAQPGDEVTIFYGGHGWYGIDNEGNSNDQDGDEPTGEGLNGDETLWINENEDLTDDKLANMIQGFRNGVTKFIILTACYAGGMTDGASDLQESDDLTVIGVWGLTPLDWWYIFGGFQETLMEDVADAVEGMAADANNDNMVTGDELKEYLRNEGWAIGPPGTNGGRNFVQTNIDSIAKFRSGKSYAGGVDVPPVSVLPSTELFVSEDPNDSLLTAAVSGQRFTANADIDILLIDSAGNQHNLGTTLADQNGEFHTSMSIPLTIDREAFYLFYVIDSEGYNDWWPLYNGTYQVTSVEDNGDSNLGDGKCDDGSGNCTLRAAIEEGNGIPGIPTIDLRGLPSVSRASNIIRPESPLPVISDPVIINGGNVELDGSVAGNESHGLFIMGGNSLVKDLIINNFNGHGILIRDKGGNTVTNTIIGTNASGSTGLGNSGAGILIENSSNNFIGGSEPSSGNTIAHNGMSGIIINGGTGNAVQRNSIYANNGLGIDLGNDGETPNDPQDADQGDNNLQNYPEIIDFVKSGSELKSTYKVTSTSLNSAFPIIVEFFRADVDGQEGQSFLGSDTLKKENEDLDKTISFMPLDTIAESELVVATATDSLGNTSEFSPAVQLMTTNITDRMSDQLNLLQNYPNPFYPSTIISYSLPLNANVRIEIFNMLGNKIRTLINTWQPAGSHRIEWDGLTDSKERATSGIYLCRFKALGRNSEAFIKTKKMILHR